MAVWLWKRMYIVIKEHLFVKEGVYVGVGVREIIDSTIL